MKKNMILMAGILWLGALQGQAQGTPKIQFDGTTFDFGKTSNVTSVSGEFKFKNVGDGVLKMQAPKPSCGCTVAGVMPDTLPPGTNGIIPFTLSLGFYRGTLEKHISVKSNDPQTPEVTLTIKVDYTPLYELAPMTLSPNLPYGTTESTQYCTVVRTDGKPLQIARLDASQPWITATLDPAVAPGATNARICIVTRRDGSPRHFNEYVHIYGTEQPNGTPVSNIYLYGQVTGEVALSPEALYWSITDTSKTAAAITQRVMIRSASGQTIQVKNAQSTIKGISLELVPQEAGKAYELIARLDEVPGATVAGNVSFETSVAAQPRIEVPVIVNVYKP